MLKHKKSIGTALLVIFGLLTACENKKEGSPLSLSIAWELDFNYSDTSNLGLAHFEVKNTGSVPLTDNNWEIYYSQMLGHQHKPTASQPYTIKNLGGEWFKIKPEKGFELSPGDSTNLYYSFQWSVDRYSDAPKGIYLVYKEDTAETVVPIEDFTIQPFTRKEQLLAGKDDDKILRTPEWLYEQNAKNQYVEETERLAIIPSPYQIKTGQDSLDLSSGIKITSSEDLSNESEFLIEKLTSVYEVNETEGSETEISLMINDLVVNGVDKEAYQLAINENGIEIIGSDEAGVFYGIQSLLSLLNNSSKLPFLSIEDSPRYGYRGFHLDVGRNFHDKEEVKKILDIMAMYKLNKFHFYIVEDEGWRIEIPSLPELTEFGSVRGHTADEKKHLHPSYGSGPVKDSGKGTGYYTTEDFIEILQYADERHIKVIPSINLPGHARSAIFAMEYRYNKLMEEGKEKEALEYRLIDPADTSKYRSAQNYGDNTVNVAFDAVYRFYNTVIRDVKKTYEQAGLELDFLHTGGDEVAEGAWTGSKYTQELLEELPDIDQARNLQIYFTRRMLDSLEQFDLTVGGWEEIALKKNDEGKYEVNREFVNEKVIPYVWNNFGDASDLTYRMIQNGYEVVICHVTNFYFDLAYNTDPEENGLDWGGYTDEYSPWTFSMRKEEQKINADGASVNLEKGVIGLQAQMWSETLVSDELLEYMLLPKLLSFAERSWQHEPEWEKTGNSELKEAEWAKFINTVYSTELPHLSEVYGVNYRIPKPGAKIEGGKLVANVPYAGLTIHYETGDKAVDNQSPEYSSEVDVDGEVRLIAVDQAGNTSREIIVKNNDD